MDIFYNQKIKSANEVDLQLLNGYEPLADGQMAKAHEHLIGLR